MFLQLRLPEPKPTPGTCQALRNGLLHSWFPLHLYIYSNSQPGKKVTWPQNYPDKNPGNPLPTSLLTHPATKWLMHLIDSALEGRPRAGHQGLTLAALRALRIGSSAGTG